MTINSRSKGELWKDVVGYEEFYEISSKGNIKSKDRYVRFVDKLGNEHFRLVKGHKLKPIINKKNGRESIMLTDGNCEHKRITVHRLVAMAFINNDNPEEFNEVNHKDENPLNNCVENLEWCNRKYNMNYGTLPGRINDKNKKPIEGVVDGNVVVSFDSIRGGKVNGYDSSGILQSIKKKKKYKGIFWRYKDGC